MGERPDLPEWCRTSNRILFTLCLILIIAFDASERLAGALKRKLK